MGGDLSRDLQDGAELGKGEALGGAIVGPGGIVGGLSLWNLLGLQIH